MTLASRCDTGVHYCGDNLERLAQLPSECVDLIYLDPPFFSNRNYEVIWGDEAEVRSFEDRWEGGINHYVDWMWDRAIEMHRVLKPTGAIFFHCDWHASHYLKVMLDQVFGYSHFRNEIIWHYKFRMMRNNRVVNRKHDSILFYAKSEAHRITPLTEPWTREEIIRVRKQTIHQDPDGREWVWMPGGKGHSKNKPKYLDDIIAEGKALDDVWDMPIISSSSKERLGYPTQKPEALLERIVKMSSQPGDVVLDPFCGCGITIVAAQRLKRQWIGIDISPTAVGLMKRRIESAGATNVRTIGLPVSEAQLKTLKPFEFQNWVIQRLNGTHSPRRSRDMGIDGYSFFEHDPIQVKRSEHVGRNVVDNFETAIERAGKNKGYIVAFSFTRDAREEVSRVKRAKGFEIELIKVADLLEDTTDLVMPAPEPSILRLPLPKPPPKEARPSVEELIESDQRAGQVA